MRTELDGTLVSAAPGSLVLNLQTIENWPVSNYNFTGNGAAAVTPASYVVDTGSLTLPALAAAEPLWIDGISAPFGSAPPDFTASSVNTEPSVPARLQVDWKPAGTTTPFSTLTSTALAIDLADPNFSAGAIRIGSESIGLTAANNPTIVPQAAPPATPGLPSVFLPQFAIGRLSAANTIGIAVYNTFATFVTQLPKSLVAATPALHFVATGLYERSSNTFTASRIDVVN
jgi:hypothetical protein